ncbi:MAG TPA: DUF6305 family protein [Candidatus Limnocylindrales bacterium]|nr:DUF6305 family protein [Candidatus Limnocylindrales bacterium]
MRVNGAKLVLFLLLGLAVALAFGCPTADPAPVDKNIVPQVEGLINPFAREPAVLTSIGQVAEVFIVKTLLEQAEIQHSFNILLQALDLTEQYKTLILEVGVVGTGTGGHRFSYRWGMYF